MFLQTPSFFLHTSDGVSCHCSPHIHVSQCIILPLVMSKPTTLLVLFLCVTPCMWWNQQEVQLHWLSCFIQTKGWFTEKHIHTPSPAHTSFVSQKCFIKALLVELLGLDPLTRHRPRVGEGDSVMNRFVIKAQFQVPSCLILTRLLMDKRTLAALKTGYEPIIRKYVPYLNVKVW